MANLKGLAGLMPELILVAGIILVILADLFLSWKNPRIVIVATVIILLISTQQVLGQWERIDQEDSLVLFPGMLSLNKMAVFFKFLFLLSGVLAVAMTAGSRDVINEGRKGEYLVMVLAVVLGCMLLTMAESLIVLYLALELVSLSSYVLVAFVFGKRPTEAAFKYFIFGAVSSGLMLYGFSLLYGLTGSLHYAEPLFWNRLSEAPVFVVVAILFLSASGFLFKIAAFPFHLWAPDIYEGAPVPIAAYLSVAPKAAGIFVLIRILLPAVDTELEGSIREGLMVIAALTLTIGNFAALWQNNAKRLLAYSSIAQTGFLVLGLCALSDAGVESVIFYISVYLVMNFAAFLMVDILSDVTGSEDVRNFKGLGIKLPFIGIIFVLTMVALTGLPPTAGFYAKLFVFSSVWESWKVTGNEYLFYLLIFGLLNAVVSLFYYLKIPYFMFFKASGNNYSVSADKGRTVLLSVLAFVLLFIFFQPAWLMEYINAIGVKIP